MVRQLFGFALLSSAYICNTDPLQHKYCIILLVTCYKGGGLIVRWTIGKAV